MSAKNPSVRTVHTCPYKYNCNCYISFSVKTYLDRVEITLAGMHASTSHLKGSGILSVKERSTIKSAVRAAPQAVGSLVHTNLENFRQTSAYRLT